MTETKNYILQSSVAAQKLRRMALEMIENNADTDEIMLVGIRDNGYAIAAILQQLMKEYSPIRVQLLAVSLDKRQPREVQLDQEASFDDKTIILVDDVANSGRTMLYALKPFLAYQPRKIQTAVLVGRSHNSFPIHPDYVGLSVATTLQEHIFVEVENGIVHGAYLQ